MPPTPASERQRADETHLRSTMNPEASPGSGGGVPPARRVPAIDRLKGLAIVGVLCIHANTLLGGIVGTYVVNRAVPVFIVLFGTTSELWWQAQRGSRWTRVVARWYRSRLSRLMLPFWGVLCAWWFALGFVFGDPIKAKFVIASFLGYAPSIGTSWFVTAIIELVVVFPLVRWAVVRLGSVRALALALVLLAASYVYMWDIIAWGRIVFHNTAPGNESWQAFGDFFYFWIFVPQHFFLVVAGIIVAQRGVVLDTRAVVAWMVALVLVDSSHHLLSDMPRFSASLLAVSDVALTVCLLSFLTRIPDASSATDALSWLGRHSWGVYQGQMLAQSLVFVGGVRTELLSSRARWLLLAYLLTAALALVRVGTLLREWLERTFAALLAPPSRA